MALYSHLATVRYLQGQGNAALYVRLRDAAGLYYNFISGTWDATDTANCRVFLVEVDDASSVESRYQVTLNLPEVNATTVLEYVRLADSMVLAEETLPARSAVTVGPTGGTALTSVANLKAYLSLKTTTDDDLLARIVVAASKWFESQVARTITLTTYEHSFVGDDTTLVRLPEAPVTSVSSVMIDDQLIPQALAAADQGWRLVGNVIYLKGYSFSYGSFVQISYTAGFAQVPADIEQAVIEVAADRFQYRSRVGQVTKSMGGESVSFVSFQIPVQVQTVIDVYRRVSI